MGYVKSTLAAEEDYLYRAKFNWTYDAISWMWFAIGAIPAAIWAFELFRQYLQIDMVSEFFTFAAGSLFAPFCHLPSVSIHSSMDDRLGGDIGATDPKARVDRPRHKRG